MTLLFSDTDPTDLSFDKESLARSVIEASLASTGAAFDAEVSLTLTDEEEIRQMNRLYRGIDRVTDVLSFPMLEYEKPGVITEVQAEANASPESGEILLGDIVLCIPKVLSQAESYGHSSEREYAFLLAHGMLHLLGYDHMEDAQREEMERMQRVIMERLQIFR